MQFTPYALPLLLAAVVNGAIVIYSWRYRHAPGATPFAAAMLSAAVWAFAYALDISSATLAGKYAAAYLRFPQLALMPVAWLFMALEFTGRARWLTPRRRRALLLLPAITAFMVWTTAYHGLFRRLTGVDMSGPFPIALFKNGPWWLVHVGYGYAALAASLVIFLLALRGASPLQRRQITLITIAILFPFLTDILFTLGITPLRGFNIASMMTLLSGVVVAWTLFRHRMLSVATIARGWLLEQMRDLMLVVSEDGRLADINAAAEAAFGLTARKAVGQPIGDLLARWPDLLAQTQRDSASDGEWSLEQAGRRQVYALTVTGLESASGGRVGRLIWLRDISERRQMEDALRESEARFRLMADHLPMPVLLTRMEDGIALYINPRTAETFGLTVEQGIGQPTPDYYVNPADRAGFVAELRRAGQIRDREALMKRANGETFWASISAVVTHLRGEAVLLAAVNDISERRAAAAERERLIGELQEALTRVKQLSGLLPICASCKKIRNDEGYWEQIEVYVGKHSEAEFSHGLCPECAHRLYPEYFDEEPAGLRPAGSLS